MTAFYTSRIFSVARVSFWTTVLSIATAQGVGYGAAGILSRFKLATGGPCGALSLIIWTDDVGLRRRGRGHAHTQSYFLHEWHSGAPLRAYLAANVARVLGGATVHSVRAAGGVRHRAATVLLSGRKHTTRVPVSTLSFLIVAHDVLRFVHGDGLVLFFDNRWWSIYNSTGGSRRRGYLDNNKN